MAQTIAKLEGWLDLYSNQALAPMLKARKIFNKQTRKPVMIKDLARALQDEANTRAAYEELDAEQKLLLHLLQKQGGRGTIKTLRVEASALGILGFDGHLHELLRYALVLYVTPARVRHELWEASTPGYNSWSQNPEYVIEGTDAAMKLAADAVELPPPAHALQAYQGEPFAIEEGAPAALLHALFNVVKWASEREITLTKTSGTLRKADQKVLDGLLKDQLELKGFALALALSGGLLQQKREKIAPTSESKPFFALAPRQQIEKLFQTWIKLDGWSEFFRIPEIEIAHQVIPRQATGDYAWNYGAGDIPTAEALPAARAYVVGILRRAGADLENWLSLASLRELVKAENPEFLIPKSRRRYAYGNSDSVYREFWPAGGTRWDSHFERDVDWDQVEGRFLRQLLCEPLTWLGLVAIARDRNGHVAAFRLSPLGAHLLGHTDQAPDLESQGEKSLIIQPNFEILAYTDAGHLRVLYQLERFATRERAERVAHYKLDRDSVYRGLQDGLSAAEMREFLEKNSRSGLPQNIAYSLDDWEQSWQSITLRPAASLLEARAEAEMDAFVGTLPDGATTRLAPTWALIEPRYLEAARTNLAAATQVRALDYSIQIGRVFETGADLEIRVPPANLDLWLQSKLEQFADAVPDDKNDKSNDKSIARFQITPDGLARAAKLGLKAADVLEFLETTGTAPLPANVTLTVNGWGGAVKPVALGSMQVVATEPGLVAQMAAIDEMKPLLWLAAGESAALVKSADVPKLKAQLKKRGIAWDAKPETHLRAPKAARRETPPAQLRPGNRAVAVGNGKARPARAAKVAAHPDENDVELQSGLDPKTIEAMMEDAIQKSCCVVIEYQSKVRRALRKIGPIQVFEDGGNIYVGAWDFWRNAERLFRTDRILRIAVLDEKFETEKFSSL